MCMNKFQGYTLISDMDGTLLNDKKEIAPENLEAIAYFVENGGHFSVASGRIHSRLRLYAKQLQVTVPVITMNGMLVQDFSSGEILYREKLPSCAEEYTKEIITRYPELGLEVFTEDTVYFIHRNTHIDKHISDEGFELKVSTLPQVHGEWIKVLFGCDGNLLEIIEREFPYMQKNVTFTKSDAHFYELLGKGASKGKALRQLISMAKLDGEKVIAVGDNQNDVAFVQTAGIGVAVANACDEVKIAAKAILNENNNQAPIKELVRRLENGELI